MKPIKKDYSDLGKGLQRLKVITAIIFLLFTVNCSLLAVNSFAEIPKLINYQGRLADAQGRPITETKKMVFKLYDAYSGGNLIWESIYDPSLQGSGGVTIEKGVFNVMLGKYNNGNGQYKELKDVPFDKQYYLEIVMEGEVLSPRQLLTSSAYAIRANVADEALQAQCGLKHQALIITE